MSVNPNDTQTNELGLSFGGIIPDTSDHPDGDYRLAEPVHVPEGEYSLTDADSPYTPKMGEVADRKIAKMQFALGNDAPDKAVMQNYLATGQEGTLRRIIADQEDSKDRQAKLDIVHTAVNNGAILNDPQNITTLENVIKHNPQNDPDTILEKTYARTYTNLIPQVDSGNGNAVKDVLQKNPALVHHAADIAEEITTKQEIAKSAAEDMEQRAKDQSWTGWVVDTAKSFVPGYNWYKTYNIMQAPTSPKLKGNNWAEQIEYLYSLDPKEMHATLRDALDKLSDDNPHLASEFANAVVGFTGSDQFWGNVGAVTDVLTVLPMSKATTVIKAGKSLITGREAESAVVTAFKDGIKANSHPTVSVPETLARVGDTSTSALLNTVKRSDEIISKVEVPLAKEDIQTRLFSLFNPRAIQADGSNLSAMETQRITQRLQANADKVLARIEELSKVERLPEEAKQIAFKEAQDSLLEDMSHVNKSVIDAQWNMAEDNAANVSSVSAFFGDRDGKMFGDQMSAWRFAKSFMRLHDDDINVVQRGTGYAIRVDRNIDETSPTVRAALAIETKTQTPQTIPHMVFGWLRSANDRVSQQQIEQRIAAVSGYSGLTEALKTLSKDIGSLTKAEHSRLARVMEDNRSWVDPTNGKIGMFHSNVAEFEQNFKILNGVYPSANETNAYFTAVQINDLDYVMRNLSLYRDRARQGLREVILGDITRNEHGDAISFNAPKFLGKEVKELPLNQDKHNASILIHNKNGETERFRLFDLQSKEKRDYIQSLLDDGYKIIQTHNPAREIAGGKYGSEPTNFVLTKDVQFKNLDVQQLPYQPGFHREYNQKYYVKQPQIRAATVGENVTHHEYDGDRTVFGFYSKPEAEKYAKAMEEARLIMNGEKPGDLAEYLKNNLPFNENKFRSLFEETRNGDKIVPPQYSKEHPFLWTYDKQTTTDAHGDFLKGKYQNLNDNVRSPWNLMANEDKKFVGQKDPDMWTVNEKGTDANPTYQLASANQVDVWSSLSKGMANVMRNRFMQDYKTQAIEAWVSEFGHLIEKSSDVDLLSNAMYHVFQPQWKKMNMDNAQQMMAAKYARQALMEFIGNESPEQTILGSVKQKMVDWTYEKAGQKASDVVSDHLLASEIDPLKAMRGFAFHTTIGLFNPVQLWQNLNTMSFTVGIGGFKNGIAGSIAGMMQRYAMINESPRVLDKLASIAETTSGGFFKSEWFKESYNELKKTGRMFVEGEHSWRDDVAQPKFFQGAGGDFLDKGQFFFREGERATRLASWNTAYLEWRAANPNVKITNAIRNQILARSDDMGANMTRASNSALQQGILNVPLQFTSYPVRIMELMLGKRLEFSEKARMMAVQSALYGIPMGTTGLMAGGVYDFYQDIRQASLRNNWNMTDATIDALHSGILGVVGAIATGRTSSLPDKAGPGGNSMLREALSGDKDLIDLALGASGSKTRDALLSAKPALRSFVDYVTGKEDKFPFTPWDALDLARNIQSVDTGTRTLLAINSGKLITKNGTYQGDVTPLEAVIAAFTGGLPRALSDPKVMKDWGKDRDKDIQNVQKEVQKWHTMALEAAAVHDDKNYDVYMGRVGSLIAASDLRPEEKSAMMKKVWELNQSQAAKVPYEFFIKKAPPSVAPGAQDQFIKSNPNPVK